MAHHANQHLQQHAFSREEYCGRVSRVQVAMAEQGVDALLTSSLSNICYLTGFETLATWKTFSLLIPSHGEPVLVGEDFELHNALAGCWINDFVSFPCMEGQTGQLNDLIRARDLADRRIGVNRSDAAARDELCFLTKDALPDAELVELPYLIESIKAIKSRAEIKYLRAAARLSSEAMSAAIAMTGQGKTDNDVAAVAYESVIAGGSEYMCLAPVVTVGRRSGIPHTTHRRIPIEVGDAVFLEIGACIARYTAPMMRTVAIGPCSQELQRMAEASATSVDTLIDHIRPGVPGGEIARYAGETLRGLPAELIWHGYYGYSVGLGFPPVWADAPVHIRDGSDSVIEAGMVFHCNTSLRRAGEYGASCGETVLVTEDGCEVLTAVPRGLQIK